MTYVGEKNRTKTKALLSLCLNHAPPGMRALAITAARVQWKIPSTRIGRSPRAFGGSGTASGVSE